MSIGQTEGSGGKNLASEGVLAANTIGKFGADKDHVVAAVAATDLLVGVTTNESLEAEDSVRVVWDGVALVRAGGTIALGAWVSPNASGQAITSTAGDSTVGQAMSAAVVGDLVPVRLSMGTR